MSAPDTPASTGDSGQSHEDFEAYFEFLAGDQDPADAPTVNRSPALLEQLFHKLLEEPQLQQRFLTRLSSHNPELANELGRLIENAGEELDRPPLVSETLPATGEAHALPPSTPQQIGPYRILQELGAGGMGRVYLAEQRKPLKRRVALKVIQSGLDAREVLTRFEAEHQALSLMNHPGIARVYDAGVTDDGRPYFVMEHVPGQSLTKYCDQNRVSASDRVSLLIGVCQAIQHAHQKGIIHRDLKPSNILVVPGDEGPVAKVIDFGVAKSTAQRLTEKTLYTEIGRLIGTPAYMSPEQAGVTEVDVDTRADVYSLGVVLYEMLTGSLPFDPAILQRRNLAEIQRAIREDEPQRPSTRISSLGARADEVAQARGSDRKALHRRLRGDLDWIVMKCLEKDRTRRYDSATELAADLRRHLENEPVVAGPPSTSYRLGKLARKHRGAVVATLLVMLSLAGGLALALARAHEIERQRDEILRLSEIKIVGDAVRAAETLWPAHPQNIKPLEKWLADYGWPLRDRLPEHESALLELQKKATTQGNNAVQESWQFGDDSLQWQHDTLQEIVSKLRRFVNEDPNIGTLQSVVDRLERASTLDARSCKGTDVKERWDRAIADIRELPIYSGLNLTPQLGLVPLRKNRQGLWEFWHVETGDEPSPNPDENSVNEWIVNIDTGVVLVLIPGGTYQVGSIRQKSHPLFDKHAAWDEEPRHDVALDPFFISKYELTQAQWFRMTGELPAEHGPNYKLAHHRNEAWNPVERVTWRDCSLWLPRFGLRLPSEVQWEAAARARTKTPWWSGETRQSVGSRGAANVADSRSESVTPEQYSVEKWPDPWIVHAPVGSFAANPFGLHDTMGNVWEWCQDVFCLYGDYAPRSGDGLRTRGTAAERNEFRRVNRGGSFFYTAPSSRASNRGADIPLKSEHDLGVRPARAVDGSSR